jgi:hypothetical protein
MYAQEDDKRSTLPIFILDIVSGKKLSELDPTITVNFFHKIADKILFNCTLLTIVL